MIIDFENPAGSRIRVWLDEPPPGLDSVSSKDWRISDLSGGVAVVRHHRVAIEIFRPFGGMFHYGLLGGGFDSTDATTPFRVRVPAQDVTTNCTWPTRLADGLVQYCSEYSESILNGVKDLGVTMPSRGVLSFDTMVHSKIGSAAIVFRALSRGVVRALTSELDVLPTKEEAFSLLA